MNHSFLDRYSDRDSLVHRLDPRTKLVGVFLFILAVALTPPGFWPAYAAYFVILAIPVALSRVPIAYIIKRSLVIIPFVLFVAVFVPFFKEGEIAAGFNIGQWQISVTHEGLSVLWNILVRAWLSILALVLLTATTKMTDLLRGLDGLRLPRVMVMILSFMYRYIFVLVDEVMRMRQARDGRNFGGGGRLWQIKATGHMAGTLFIRSYERGERVYAAMLARGYDGQNRTLRQLAFQRGDIYFALLFGLAVILTVTLSFVYQVR